MQSPVKKMPSFNEEGKKYCLGCALYLDIDEFGPISRSSRARPSVICRKCSVNSKWLDFSFRRWGRLVNKPNLVREKIMEDMKKFSELGPPKKSLFGRR